MTKREQLIELGFKELPHFTIGYSLNFDLGRNRHLSFSCIDTPNEVLFLCEVTEEHGKIIDDLICLRNFDYDGYTTVEEVKQLIDLLRYKKTLGKNHYCQASKEKCDKQCKNCKDGE